jgi:hypothetical protein
MLMNQALARMDAELEKRDSTLSVKTIPAHSQGDFPWKIVRASRIPAFHKVVRRTGKL